MTASPEEKQKKTAGRRKIEMKRIESRTHRQVTFAKRKKTLFQSASSFSTLFGTQVAVILSSPGGRFFSFGVPDADSVVDRYLADDSAAASSSQPMSPCVPPCQTAAPGSVDSADVPAPSWWDCSIEGMGVEELEQYCASLEALREDVQRREMGMYPDDDTLFWADLLMSEIEGGEDDLFRLT